MALGDNAIATTEYHLNHHIGHHASQLVAQRQTVKHEEHVMIFYEQLSFPRTLKVKLSVHMQGKNAINFSFSAGHTQT